jgi:hypothetical protein
MVLGTIYIFLKISLKYYQIIEKIPIAIEKFKYFKSFQNLKKTVTIPEEILSQFWAKHTLCQPACGNLCGPAMGKICYCEGWRLQNQKPFQQHIGQNTPYANLPVEIFAGGDGQYLLLARGGGYKTLSHSNSIVGKFHHRPTCFGNNPKAVWCAKGGFKGLYSVRWGGILARSICLSTATLVLSLRTKGFLGPPHKVYPRGNFGGRVGRGSGWCRLTNPVPSVVTIRHRN